MPESPLLRDELPPIRPSLLDFNPTTRHMENLDALRIVAMAVIIITHVLAPYVGAVVEAHKIDHAYGAMFNLAFAVDVSSRFGVPCFMMISFFIYWHQLYDKHRTWGQLLARRFKRLFPAFVCWSLFYILLHKLVIKLTGKSHNEHFTYIDLKQSRTWVDVLAFGKAEYHLYYLAAVMQCLLLIPLLRLLWRKPIVAWTWIALTIAGWSAVAYGLALAPPTSTLHRAVTVLTADPTVGGHTGPPVANAAAAGVKGANNASAARVAENTGSVAPTATLPPAMPATVSTTTSAALIAAPYSHPWYKGILNEETALPLLVFPLLGMMCAGQRALRDFIARTSTSFWVGLLLVGLALHLAESFYLKPYHVYDALTSLKAGRLVTGLAVFILFLRRPLMRDPMPRVSHHAFGMHFMHPAVILALTLLESHYLGADMWLHHPIPLLAINLMLTFAITFALCLLLSATKRLEFLVV